MKRRRRADGTDRWFRAVLLVLLTDAGNITATAIWRLSGARSPRQVDRWLTRLRANRWVTTRLETPIPENRPALTFYRLTSYGRREARLYLGLEHVSPDDQPTEIIPAPPAPCGTEHDRANALERRVHLLQDANMAADRRRR
ncbi:hypothetical protein DQ384_26175 [Sphaerisporangium album]|uniref:Uncharacterized protein n=1 Tax=Sphaerisporangium album TaxID=509200 RepID=A0A367FB84_9ACTN|nr:hypothetical protein [Sphaerisporangium album]RCG27209.1 hypothetical protein DQ384_26175 [Sphaerisporangium album]